MTRDDTEEPAALPTTPYTWRRFLRESVVAVAILAVGLPSVLLLGRADDPDGFTTPTAYVLSGSSLSRSVSQEALERLGFSPRVEVVAGAGFARARRGKPLAVLLRDRDLAGYDLLVVQGGEADNVAAEGELSVAMAHLLDYVGAAAPELPVVVIGPIPSGPKVSPSMRRSVGAIRQACVDRGVHFIDGLARGWTAEDPGLADSLRESLQQLGLG